MIPRALQLRSELVGFASTTIVLSPRSPGLSRPPFSSLSRDEDGGGAGGASHDAVSAMMAPPVVHGTQAEQVRVA